MRPSFASCLLLASTLSLTAASSSTKKGKNNAAADNNPDDPTVWEDTMVMGTSGNKDGLGKRTTEDTDTGDRRVRREGDRRCITEPACGFYRCTVTWNIGEQVAVNWLGPPGGNVAVSLMSNIGGPTYPITNSIAGTSQEGYCDAGYGTGVAAPGHECGRIEFVVPSGWEKMDNYTIVVQSLDNPDEIGYTDMITIAGGSNNAPSGNSVSLVTIPAPTSTNYGASQKPGISIPSPTAVTGQPTSSSAASRSSALSSASSMSVSSRSGQSSSVSSSSQIASSTASIPSAVSAGTSPSASSTTPSSAASSNLVLQTGTAFFALALAATYCL
ncbi:hypothetical protein JCM16303_005510 [Sporobolomyces ruberrimus]